MRWKPNRSPTSVWRGTSWPAARFAVAAIVVAAVIAGAGVVLAVQGYERAQRDARADSAKLARDTASEASALVVIRIEYLRGIAASEPVVRQDRPAIQALLRAMLGRHVVLDDLGWVDADGKGAIAANRPLAQTARIDLSDRAYVKAVRRTRHPYVSDAIAGRVSGAPIVVLAVPAFDRGGRLSGVLTGVLRIAQLRPALHALGAGNAVKILDRGGRVIVGGTAGARMQPVANEALFAEIRREQTGVFEGESGLDGSVDQLTAFASSPQTGWTVVVSEPLATVYGPARNALVDRVMGWVGLLLGVGALAFLAGRRLDRATRERVTATADFVAAAGWITAATTVAEIAEIYTEALKNALGAVSATVAVVEGDEIVPYFAPGTRDETIWHRLPWESPVGAAIVTRERVAAGTPEALRARFPAIVPGLAADRVVVSAICAVPFPGAGRLRGATAALFDTPRKLNENEWLLLEAYVDHVAPAIERAKLYEGERRQRLRAEEAERREHAVAIRLQRALLPEGVVAHPSLIVTARYQPGTEHLAVGGDWYDSFLLADGRVALTIGDVAGHGVDAAATMGRIRSAIQALSQADPDPGALLTELEVFVAPFDDLEFLTVCHCILDPETGSLDYASAGHPPILLLDPEGTPSFLESGRSPALPYRATRPTAHVTIAPGSRLVLFSDGLVERKTELLDLGLARLAECAQELRESPCEEFADGLLERLYDGAVAGDDAALLVVDLVTVARARG